MVTDLTHYDRVHSLDPKEHRRLFRLVDKLGAIVKAGTVGRAGQVVATGLECDRRGCPGFIVLDRKEVPPEITWSCPGCRDAGVIRNFRGTIWDIAPCGDPTEWTGEWREVSLSPNEYTAVRSLKIADPDSERTVYRADLRGGLVVVGGQEGELLHLSGLVADEAMVETDRRRRSDLNAVFDRISEAVGPPF